MPNRMPVKYWLIFAQMVLITFFAPVFGSLQPGGLEYAGVFDLRQAVPKLDGSGVKITNVCRSMTYVEGEPQNDYLFNISHNCFNDRDIEFSEGVSIANGISEHATIIGGILAGFDPNGFCKDTGNFKYEGSVYNADINVHEFWRFVSTYIYGQKKFDADILSLSVGSIFERWWTRGIENYIDESGLVVAAGIGNGSEVHDPVLYPAAGANVIGVGVIDSIIVDGSIRYTLPCIEHSSMGPTNDGRCGPDVVAAGNMAAPDANTLSGYSLSGDWSSFATPVVSGTIGLLMQKAKSDTELNDAANNLVMRAIILNSAKKLPCWHKGQITPEDDHEYPLDFLQGAGAIDAVNAYEHLTAGRGGTRVDGSIGWDENAIPRIDGSEYIYKIYADDFTGKYVTASLVWNKHYQNEYPFESLPESDTNLKLEVWGIGKNDERQLADYSNSANDNIEHVYLPADPNFVSYDLIVKVDGAGDGGNEYETYGLAWSVKQHDINSDELKYDLDFNGTINGNDLDVLLEKINKPYSNYAGDFNLDGVIDVDDVTELLMFMMQKNVNLAVIE